MEVRKVKTTLLLATTLFLVSAPSPDSRDIAEMTSNFIILDETPGLLAAEEPTQSDVAPTPQESELPDVKETEKEPAKDAGPEES